MSSIRLLNAYGPTETTITATAFEVTPRLRDCSTLQRIPIGRPLANREIYILNKYGNPVPVGVPGELYIGGAVLGSRLSEPSRFDRREVSFRTPSAASRERDCTRPATSPATLPMGTSNFWVELTDR